MDEPPTLRMLLQLEHKLDRVDEDVHDIKVRITAVEEAQAGIHRRLELVDVK
jgi:hypothetical protein